MIEVVESNLFKCLTVVIVQVLNEMDVEHFSSSVELRL